MSDTCEDPFSTAQLQLDVLVRRHQSTLESRGISVHHFASEQKCPDSPRFTRYTFETTRLRGQDIAGAYVSISLNETDPKNVTMWQGASLSQDHQVAWWDQREQSLVAFSTFLAMDLPELMFSSLDKNLDSTHAPVRTTSPQIAALLYELCVNGGFCLPRPETENLLNNPPADIDEFTDAVFRAEKMNPYRNSHLRAGVRAFIERFLATPYPSPTSH